MTTGYNWKSHYKDRLHTMDCGDDFALYCIENETGSGKVLSWDVLSGVQLIYNRLEMERCAKPAALRKDVIEISYCAHGSYESSSANERSFIIGSGDLSVGSVGRAEAPGWFPTGHYDGFTLFIEKDIFKKTDTRILRDLKIDLDAIGRLTGSRAQRFVLHRGVEAEPIMEIVSGNPRSQVALPLLRLRCLELMIHFSCPEMRERGTMPTFVSDDTARVASLVQKRITANLRDHVTIEQLARELRVGSTMVKTSFRKIYGMSVYAYLKDCRLREAKRLLIETDWSVAEVALKVGYANPGKFSLAFKQQYGIQPGRIRVQTD